MPATPVPGISATIPDDPGRGDPRARAQSARALVPSNTAMTADGSTSAYERRQQARNE